jgi:hypothetical protein
VTLLAIAGALGLAACAARTVTPVTMTQAGDEQLSCSQLSDQINVNQKTADDFLQKDKDVQARNVAKITAAAVVPGLGFSKDLSNEEQVKARSILDRNERLTFLFQSKGCNKQ